METQAILSSYFKLNERSSCVAQEIRGGISTFLTMSYILLVNPQIMSKVGLSPTDVVISTALSSGIASLFAGFFGNLPVGLAPGLGFSAYLVYGLILGDGLSIKQAFTSCFISGILLGILSVLGVSQIIMKMIPKSVKVATIIGMGLQIALVGMTSVNLVVPNPQTIVGLGSLLNYKLWISFGGLLLIGTLIFHKIPGSILIGILSLTVLSWYVEDRFPTHYVQFPSFESNLSDFVGFDDWDFEKCLPGIIAFLFIGLIDISGVVFGMASLAEITQSDGQVPGSLFGFLGASMGTIVSALTGGTPLIIYVESAAGIKEGSRTGLTGIVIGTLFIASLLFAPCFAHIPVTATSPVAILVGAIMMSQSTELDWSDMSEAIPAFLTLTIMPLTFSITNGILFGLLAAVTLHITTGKLYSDLFHRPLILPFGENKVDVSFHQRPPSYQYLHAEY